MTSGREPAERAAAIPNGTCDVHFCCGSPTTLASGRFVGFVVEAGAGNRSCYLLAIADDGCNWTLSSVVFNGAAEALTPHGKMIEIDGKLVVGVYRHARIDGKPSQGLEAGVIRSDDGGWTWGDPSVVAHGTMENRLRFNENDRVM